MLLVRGFWPNRCQLPELLGGWVDWFNLIYLFMKFIINQIYVSKPWPASTVCLVGVFNGWHYNSQKHILEMKGKTMYLYCKMVYNKV